MNCPLYYGEPENEQKTETMLQFCDDTQHFFKMGFISVSFTHSNCKLSLIPFIWFFKQNNQFQNWLYFYDLMELSALLLWRTSRKCWERTKLIGKNCNRKPFLNGVIEKTTGNWWKWWTWGWGGGLAFEWNGNGLKREREMHNLYVLTIPSTIFFAIYGEMTFKIGSGCNFKCTKHKQNRKNYHFFFVPNICLSLCSDISFKNSCKSKFKWVQKPTKKLLNWAKKLSSVASLIPKLYYCPCHIWRQNL